MKIPILAHNKDWYTLFCLFAFAICLIFPFIINIPLRYAPLWWLISFHFSFCVNLINHNHAHVPTFNSKKLNFLMDILLTCLRGASASFIKIIHNINHHKYEGLEQDWFSPKNEGHGNSLVRAFNYILITARRFKNGAKEFNEKMDDQYKKTRKNERIALIIFISVLILINIKIFIIFVLPAWIFGNFFLVYTNLIFHKNANPRDKLENSYNFSNALENYLYFNGGYHTIHHLHPYIHWSKLPETHKIEIASKVKPSYLKNSMFVHMFKAVLGNQHEA